MKFISARNCIFSAFAIAGLIGSTALADDSTNTAPTPPPYAKARAIILTRPDPDDTNKVSIAVHQQQQIHLIESEGVLKEIAYGMDLASRWGKRGRPLALPKVLSQLREMLCIRPFRNTKMIEVIVRAGDREEAKNIAMSVIDSYRTFRTERYFERIDTIIKSLAPLEKDQEERFARAKEKREEVCSDLGISPPSSLGQSITIWLSTIAEGLQLQLEENQILEREIADDPITAKVVRAKCETIERELGRITSILVDRDGRLSELEAAFGLQKQEKIKLSEIRARRIEFEIQKKVPRSLVDVIDPP